MSLKVKALVLHLLHRRREKGQFFSPSRPVTKKELPFSADNTFSHTFLGILKPSQLEKQHM